MPAQRADNPDLEENSKTGFSKRNKRKYSTTSLSLNLSEESESVSGERDYDWKRLRRGMALD